MSPFFSIILPIYNIEAYLRRGVQSILEQSFQDYEIILVDDGSTDGSPAICDEYAKQYECIRVIHKPNGGLSSARNAGLEIAQGIYVWFVDPDDWIEPDALEQLHLVSCDLKNDIVKFGYYRLEDANRKENSADLPGSYEGKEQLHSLRKRALCEAGKYMLSACTHIYRRCFLKEKEIRFVSEKEIGSEDYLFNLLALMNAERVMIYERSLYNYELRLGSLTQQYKPDLPERYTRLYRYLKENAIKNDVMRQYDTMIDRFYVWHLIFGTCIGGEYRFEAKKAGMENVRKNVKRVLRIPEFSKALRSCDCSGFSWQRRVQMIAMQLRLEIVLFWIFTRKK